VENHWSLHWDLPDGASYLSSLTGVHAGDLRNRTVPASDVLPESTVAALRTLTPDVPLDDRREVVDAALAALGGKSDTDYDTLLDVVGTMLADRSMVRVGQVEAASGLGTRSLQRLFARYVGVSPKWVLARYRMHDVVTALDEGYDGSLADLAARHGWFDQAHFTREFTTLVGVPPGEYRRHL